MKSATKGGVAGLAVTIAFIGGWEGLRTTAYLDPIGIPTVCYGETLNVKMGDSYTKAQCDGMLAKRLQEFERRLDACLHREVPELTKVAFLSHSYNVGSKANCNSTMIRKANAGDLMGACRELPKWNKAGGKVLFGLVRRRASERVMCEAGVTGKPFDLTRVLP